MVPSLLPESNDHNQLSGLFRCKPIMLSPVLSGEKTIEDIMLHPPKWYDDKGIKFIAGDKAVKIDRIDVAES
jgi:MinD-like ATPase involved in chromosome partitioning or flagellar assembly